MERKGFRNSLRSMVERIRASLESISVYTITFICLDEAYTKTTTELTGDGETGTGKGRTDEVLTDCLTEKKAINWCRTTSKMAALKNGSRGRISLLGAVSKSMWAVEDRETETFLQRLMDMNLSSARESARFKERWENDAGVLSNANHPAKVSSWEEVCRAFKDNNGVWDERSGDVESIHIFTLANVIKRPIVVIEADDDDDFEGKVEGPSGLYLPSLMSPDKCFRSPIILAFREGRFNPIVVKSETKELDRQTPRIKATPLVSHRFVPFHARNLDNEETRKRGSALLETFLNVEEIPCMGPNALNRVLAARLTCLRPELHDDSSGGKFTETCHTRILNEPKKMSGVSDYTAVLLESSGLRCSDPLCNQPVDREYYPKCRLHGTSEGSPLLASNRTAKVLVRTKSELAPKEVNEPRYFDNCIPGKCVATHCQKTGMKEYEDRCYYCYVIGNDLCSTEKAETFESGGLKSSEELSREGLNGELLENGGRDPRPFHSGTKRSGDEPKETRYERQISDQPKCTAPICENVGLTTYNGLCIECFNTLWKAKESGIGQAKGIMRANIAEITGPAWTASSRVSGRLVATKAKCLTDGCHLPVDDLDLGLCSSCSNQQRQVLEAYERRRRTGGSRRPPSPPSPKRTPPETYGLVWHSSNEPPFQGQPLPGQPKLLGLTQTQQQRLGTSSSSPRPAESARAKMCPSNNCDRYGDPGYGGYCSLCYVRRN